MDGIICVNKPKGITSFDVIRRLRKILKEKRIGHTGTLDPLATGVLVVCIGRATKLVQDIESYEKRYTASFELGFKTDTYDLEGAILETSDLKKPNTDILNKILLKFKGDIKQIPPMYSAIKVNGKKLYDLAREGIVIERKSRSVTIKELNLLDYDGKKGRLDCLVSKGTYIRSLIFDLGEELKTFATMTDLIRTQVGNTHLKNCYTLEEINNLSLNENISFMSSVEDFFKFPKLDLVGENNLKYYKNGNSFSYNFSTGYYSIYYENNFIGLGYIEKKRLKAYKFY
ncbi:MAG: tRNA pseudouridine(55) synthase TruB [Fusobacteriaceae bacterium]